jgi:hypothetical protein
MSIRMLAILTILAAFPANVASAQQTKDQGAPAAASASLIVVQASQPDQVTIQKWTANGFFENEVAPPQGLRWLQVKLMPSGSYSLGGTTLGDFKIKDENNTTSIAYAAAVDPGKFMPDVSKFLGNPGEIEILFVVPETAQRFTLEAPASQPIAVVLKANNTQEAPAAGHKTSRRTKKK